MKSKDIEQLKNKADSELQSDINKSKDKLWQLQVDLRAGKLKNVSDITKTKKMIARMKTILSANKTKKSINFYE